MSSGTAMSSDLCQGTTKKGTPCKNKAVENGFCRVHAKTAQAENPGSNPNNSSNNNINNNINNNVTPISAAINRPVDTQTPDVESPNVETPDVETPNVATPESQVSVNSPSPSSAANVAVQSDALTSPVAAARQQEAPPAPADTVSASLETLPPAEEPAPEPIADTIPDYIAESITEPSTQSAADTASDTVVSNEVDKQADSAAEQKPTTKTFDLIVNTGATLVDGLSKAIQHTPGVMDKLFTYSGAKMAMPEKSERLQETATEKTQKRLEKFQHDLIAMGADQQKLDQLLEKTQHLEEMVERTLKNSGKLIPDNLRTELKKSLERIKALKK